MIIRPVILTGGSGTRLWPVSRKNIPKPYIPMFKNKTLLEITLQRVISIKYFAKPLIICNKNHDFMVRDILNKLKIEATLMLEPEGKGTAAAIYLAAVLSDKNEYLFIMPSDHIFQQDKELNDLVFKLRKIHNNVDWILFGIKPTFASTEYGYIEIDVNLNKNNKKLTDIIFDVNSFKEKPKKRKAEDYFKRKNYFWNSGMFFANVNMIKKSIKKISINQIGYTFKLAI